MKSCLSPGQDGKDRETAPDGAEAHRRIFGGRDLTTAFESGAFSESIADGTFQTFSQATSLCGRRLSLTSGAMAWY